MNPWNLERKVYSHAYNGLILDTFLYQTLGVCVDGRCYSLPIMSGVLPRTYGPGANLLWRGREAKADHSECDTMRSKHSIQSSNDSH